MTIKKVHLLLHILVTFLLFVLKTFSLGSEPAAGVGNTTVSRCIERERQALLVFKRGLVDEYGGLSSWGNEEDERDCCRWKGVYCNNYTGHVTQLRLSSFDNNPFLYKIHIAGKITPSLLQLRHLKHLELRGSDFGGMPIPYFIGSLAKLVYLDLSYANFCGTIPRQLANLTKLRHLALSGNRFQSNPIPEFIGSLNKLVYLDLSLANFYGAIPSQLGNLSRLQHLDVEFNFGMYIKDGKLDWLSRLSSLTYLDMSDVDFSKANHWVDIVKSLPSLLELRLRDCHLSSSTTSAVMSPTLFFINSSSSPSLAILDLSDNNLSNYHWLFNLSRSLLVLTLSGNLLKGPIPNAFSHMTSLKSLSLSANELEGVIPTSFGNMSSLTDLMLDQNRLEGSLSPKSFRSFPSLSNLALSNNQFTGILPDFGECPSLLILDLSNNDLSGTLRDFTRCPSLSSLNISSNRFRGPLPDFTACSSLLSLDLSNNKFSGPLPETVGQLSRLEYLDISNNSLEGVVSEGHLSNLSSLGVLMLSFNTISFNLSSQWVSPFQLGELHLRSCKLGPQFPNWIRTQREFYLLDLSNNEISDSIPTWFWDISTELIRLNLSSNKIRGILPNFKSEVYSIDLSSNYLEGPIPTFRSNVSSLNLSKNRFSGTLSFLQETKGWDLLYLDISHNLLSGGIPDCWMYFEKMTILNFAYNNLSGEIPRSLGFLLHLEVLVLHKNNLSGELPVSLRNCTQLSFLDLGANNFSGFIPTWIGENLSKLYVLILRSNEFFGSISLQLCHLRNLQILDLSMNNIFGEVPKCFNNFTAMIRVVETPSGISEHEYFVWYESRSFYDTALVVWKGGEFEFGRNLKFVKSIDMSNNKLTGELPETITALLELVALNISNNNIYGNIPPEIGNLKSLESLDLSNNKISGGIPASMSYLNFLSYLNWSNNNLSGKIPSGTQLQGFNASTYTGNYALCGTPLVQKCPGNESSQVPSISVGNEGTDAYDRWFYIGAALGFSTTFWGICGALFLNRQWRHAYFVYLDNLKDWIYVAVRVYVAKLLRI